MKRLALIPLLFLASFCAGSRGDTTSAQPGHGAISIQVVPNPIVATKVSGDTYEFPLQIVIRETGGRPVEIARVSAEVFALGGIRIAEETYDAAEINRLGYSTRIPANGEARYRFVQRRSVPDDRLFSGVSADLTVDGRDDTGTATTATTSVTVTR